MNNSGKKVANVFALILDLIRQNKKLVFIVGGGLLTIILIVIGISRSDPVEMVKEFEKAIVMGDVKKVESLVSSGDSDLNVDQKRLKQFIDYAQKNQDYFSAQIWVLEAQTAYHTESDDILYYSIDGTTTKELLEAGDFYIKKGSFLFFDTYSIAVRPKYLNLTTNEADALLYVDGEEVFKTTKEKKSYSYGPVMPGIYKISAKKKFDFASVTAKDEVNLFHESKKNIPVDLELVGETVEVVSDVKGTTIFANGKRVGLVEELETFGPLTKDGSIKIHGEAKFPWGVSKSEASFVYEYDDEIEVTPNPTTDEKVRNKITTLINTYAKERSKSLAAKDAKGVTTLTGKEKESLFSEIEKFKEDEGVYKGKPIKTKIDYGEVKLKQDEDSGSYYMTVPVEFHFNEKKHTRWSFGNRSGPPEDKVFQCTVHVVYNYESSKWLINHMEYHYYINHFDMDGADVVESNLE